MERAFASKVARRAFYSVVTLFLASYLGSRFFTHIDLALYGYMVGTLVFIGGFLYRFTAWADRPPTNIILKKGLRLLLRKSTPQTAVEHLATYRFIWNRGWYRWTQHVLLGWGCILSAFVTFPLVFGWMYFTMGDNGTYTVVAMGVDVMKVKADGWIAFLFYNALNITAFMVIAGVCMALYRRLKNMQARAEQSFLYDFLPLYLLLLISVSGLLLTASNLFFDGFGHPVISLIHQFSVIVTLIYLPFGKLAHIPFRPMSVFARNYREHYGGQEMKCCRVCGEGFVSAEQSSDVIDVLQENQIRFQMAEGFHLAELCLPCRRKYRIYRFTGTPVHQHPEKEANQHAKG
ncbi:MAG: putative rane protein [Brevibacillus sp.]|nr:putative rane protein [Brevibacillus sp.]